jgi:hypothetical protein
MVKRIWFCLLAVLLCSCSVKDWWGERFNRHNLEVSQAKSPCADFSAIIKGSDTASETTFNCWKNELSNAWNKVQGEQKFSLTNGEIEHLIKSRIVSLPGNPEKVSQQVLSAKALLGIEKQITKADFDSWMKWADKYRDTARSLYNKWTFRKDRFTWKDSQDFLEIAYTALRKANWDLYPDQIAEKMTWVMNLKDTDFEPVMKPMTHVVLDLLNMLCPFGKEATRLTSILGAGCIHTFSQKFGGAAKWMEYLLNPTNELSVADKNEIIKSLNDFEETAKAEWFNRQGFSTFKTNRWWEFAQSLDILVTRQEFTDSLFLIQRWTHGTDQIMPSDFALKVIHVLVEFQKSLLEGLPEFVNATKDKVCANEAKYWTECVLKDSETLRSHPKFDMFFRVRNLNYGSAVSQLSGHEFSKMMLYDALANETIETFDVADANGKKDGIIYSNSNDHSLHEAITSAVRFADLWDSFISNIQSKWNSQPIKRRETLDQKGLAELMTMTSDLFVTRKEEDKSRLSKLWEGVLANFTNVLPSGSYYLDRMSVTAIFSAINILPQFRSEFLKLSSVPADAVSVKRATLMAHMDEWLEKVFPRTERSCRDFGYDKSCKTVIEALIPNHPKIATSDLDIVSIYAMTVESIIDTCDRDHDAKLSWDLFDGNDELDCGFITSSTQARSLCD